MPTSTPQISLCHLRATKSGTGRSRHLNDWSWGDREESAFASNAFALSASPSVVPKPALGTTLGAGTVTVSSTVAPMSAAKRSPAAGSRSRQKESAPLGAVDSPLLTLLAAACLMDDLNYRAGQTGADEGGGGGSAAASPAAEAAAAGSGSKGSGASRATPSVQNQGGAANLSAKAPGRRPPTPTPVSSPAMSAGRLTERQQLQRAIEESLGLPTVSEADNAEAGSSDASVSESSDEAKESDACSDLVLPAICMHACMHSCIHAYIPAICMHACIHVCIYIYTCIHLNLTPVLKHIHTHTHTHTHTGLLKDSGQKEQETPQQQQQQQVRNIYMYAYACMCRYIALNNHQEALASILNNANKNYKRPKP